MFKKNNRWVFLLSIVIVALSLSYYFTSDNNGDEVSLSFAPLEWTQFTEDNIIDSDEIVKGKVVNRSEKTIKVDYIVCSIIEYEFEIIENLKKSTTPKSSIRITMLNDPKLFLENNEEYVIFLEKNTTEDSYTPISYSQGIFKESNGILNSVFGYKTFNYNSIKQRLIEKN